MLCLPAASTLLSLHICIGIVTGQCNKYQYFICWHAAKALVSLHICKGVFSSFRACFSWFTQVRVAHSAVSSFRKALFRLFVFSRGILSLFSLFAWFYFVFSRCHNHRQKDKKKLNSKMAQTRHNAVTPVRLEIQQKVGPDQDPNCLPLWVGVQRSDMGFWMICF